MAQYKVQFACGHEETVNLFGPMKDRESRIAYLEKYGSCSECKKKEREAQNAEFHAKAVANADRFPALEGSEKQVAWALDIRQRWMDYVSDCYPNKEIPWDDIKQKFELMTEEQQKQLLARSELTSPTLYKTIQIITNHSAKFFIDNRDY